MLGNTEAPLMVKELALKNFLKYDQVSATYLIIRWSGFLARPTSVAVTATPMYSQSVGRRVLCPTFPTGLGGRVVISPGWNCFPILHDLTARMGGVSSKNLLTVILSRPDSDHVNVSL